MSHSMNLNKSSLQYDRQHSNQIKNLTTTINSILSSKQLLPNDDHLTSASFFIRYKFIFLIILSFSILILSILIFLLILKRTRTEDTNIQRPQAAIERHVEPESNVIDGPQAPLLPKNDDRMINNIDIISNPDNPILEKQSTDITPATSGNSSISISSPHLSTTNNDDGLADVNFSDIRLRPIKPPDDLTPPKTSENIHIVAAKQLEEDKKKAQILDGSTTSEESCL